MTGILKKIFILFLLVSLYGCPQEQNVQPQDLSAGIKTEVFNYYASSQRNSQWCWAASIQMILNYYGIDITQEQIVARSYGTDPYGQLPNWPGSFEIITQNLNNWGIDNKGQSYIVSSQLFWGAPVPSVLLNEMLAERPVLIGYNTGSSGHAVVITAVYYQNSYYGPIINKIVVRDPWPDQQNVLNLGRKEYYGNQLASIIQAYWYIRVLKN